MLNTPMTKRALRLCLRAHEGQVDHSDLPYALHPIHLAEQFDCANMIPLLLNEARRRGIRKVLLHASQMGRPVYERQGFKANDSWMELSLS